MKTLIACIIVIAGLTSPSWSYTVEKTVVSTPVKVPVWIALPDTSQGKIPAVLLVHGSGGIVHDHEWGYAKFFTERGIATIIIDSFTPRGIKSTVLNQSLLPARAMMRDALQVLQSLTNHPKIDVDRVGIIGFSKGAQAAFLSSLAVFNRPGEKQFALTIAMYPPCNEARYQPKTTGKPLRLVVGELDTYNHPKICRELYSELKQVGVDVTLTTIPNAKHGWDVPRQRTEWQNPKGENYSRCRFIEVSPRNWIERSTGIQIANEKGEIKEGRKKALASCITYGVSGGYNAEAARQSLKLIEEEASKLQAGR